VPILDIQTDHEPAALQLPTPCSNAFATLILVSQNDDGAAAYTIWRAARSGRLPTIEEK
jgi:hypothetical protein